MLIGSNNSLTYLIPSNWWLKPFKNFGRHQNIPYDEQYTFWGVRLFDFRLYADKNNHIIAKNNTVEYPLFSFYEILDYFDKRGDVTVLITLDASSFDMTRQNYDRVERKFCEMCNVIESIYHDIRFIGGYRKEDGKRLFEFKWEKNNKINHIIRPNILSPVYRFVSNWCPFLIGKLNRKYLDRFKDEPVFLMLDYVNKR